jgi:signal transduction histidine kinase
LHHQLALMVSVALVSALGLLGGYTALEQTQIALKTYEEQALALARHMGAASHQAMVGAQPEQVADIVLRSAESGSVVSVRLLKPSGQPLLHVAREQDALRITHDAPGSRVATPARAVTQIEHDEPAGRLVIWQPVITNLLEGWVRLEYDTRDLQALRWRIWRNTLVVAALAVAGCGLMLAWVLRKPLRALQQAKQFAADIAQADGRQLSLEGGPIEVMELNRALNEASMMMRQQLLIIEDWFREHSEHEARLAERNAQLGAIFSLSRDGLLTLDQDQRVLFANRSFMQLTGLSSEEVVGSHLSELSDRLQQLAQPGSRFEGLSQAFPPADSSAAPAPATPAPAVDEQLLVLGEGVQRSVVNVTGQRSDSPAVSGVLYLTDVTRQHTLDQIKSEFLSMAAHELRTPMVSIFGFTELMLKREMSAEQRTDLLGRIHRHGQSMIAILNELLDLARIESRRGQDFKFEEVDFATVVQSVLTDYKPPVGRDTPVVQLPPGPMPVRADVHKLQQAVLNIVSNAYKYSPEGGEVAVRFTTRRDEHGRLRHGVTIEDHGMGLSPSDLARLGERFFRVDKSGNIPGTGLGVSIVKELMELMGGRMQVHSTLGEGTQVSLWL